MVITQQCGSAVFLLAVELEFAAKHSVMIQRWYFSLAGFNDTQVVTCGQYKDNKGIESILLGAVCVLISQIGQNIPPPLGARVNFLLTPFDGKVCGL